MHDKDSIVVQEIVNLLQERAVSSNTDVLRDQVQRQRFWGLRTTHLGHLEGDNLVERALGVRKISEVHAEDSTLGFRNTIVSESLVTEGGLVLSKGD